MDTPADPPLRATGSSSPCEEDLFDRYFDAALSGDPPHPEEFLAEVGSVSGDLVERLRAVHAESLRRRAERGAVGRADDDLPFARLGEYRLVRRLDQGGMGTVFLAEQEPLGRSVAIKVMRAEFRGSESAAARFDREMQTLAKLRHPNIVTIHGAGNDRGVRYLAMEYVEGRDLDSLLDDASESVPAARVVAWGARLARALAAAHAGGIVHRDVKPSNVRIAPDGEPILLDFGVARDEDQVGLTGTGPLVGTPLYAAPEQIRADGTDVDTRADVYGLGATLYECLTGRPPAAGATVEQVMHAVLHLAPVPPRRLEPSLSRDLEVVILTALEKDPARRYQSARAFADDLEALLEMRPIRARPPGPARRVREWARRHRAVAGALGALIVAGAAVLGVVVVQHRTERRERLQEARDLVAAVASRLDDVRGQADATLELENRIGWIDRLRESHHLDDAIALEYKTSADAVIRLRLDRERAFSDVTELLRRAERLDPDVPGVDAMRARVLLERWRDAHRRKHMTEAAHFRQAALRLDPNGTALEAMIGTAALTLVTEPPGAEVHLFRYRIQAEVVPGGDRRLVPVSVGGDDAVPPGTWALRVVRGAGPLVQEDAILAVDGEPLTPDNARELRARVERGGVRARVCASGAVHDLVLPAGLSVRATAAPLLAVPGTFVGKTPLRALPLEPGSYVALVRLPGHEPQRVVCSLGAYTADQAPVVRVELHVAGTSPPGFAFVSASGLSAQNADRPAFGETPRREHFWIMEREVTCAEYLGFLNDPATQSEIAAAPGPTRFPRDVESAGAGGFWPRDADGRYRIPAEGREDWPVLGVSYDDAVAYADWYSRREQVNGSSFDFALPTYSQWVAAGEGSADRSYPFGPFFWPRWTSSCFAQPEPSPEPVLSYPVDESPFGVFDMAGSATEWCAAWWGGGQHERRLCGASWAQARTDLFKVTGGSGAPPDEPNEETGFRLVAQSRGGSR